MAFGAIVAPGLVLCGVMLYGSNLVLATGKTERESVPRRCGCGILAEVVLGCC